MKTEQAKERERVEYQPAFMKDTVIGQFVSDSKGGQRYESWRGSWFSLDGLNWASCQPYAKQLLWPAARIVMKYGDCYRMIPTK